MEITVAFDEIDKMAIELRDKLSTAESMTIRHDYLAQVDALMTLKERLNKKWDTYIKDMAKHYNKE